MYKEKVEFLSKQTIELDPFFNLVDSKKIFSEIRDELDEAEEEFEKGDFKELEKELGDVFRDFLMLSHKLEQEGKINIEKIYEGIYKKMSGRKPFLEENREVTQQEAIEIWNEAKRKEGYPEERLWTEERTNLN